MTRRSWKWDGVGDRGDRTVDSGWEEEEDASRREGMDPTAKRKRIDLVEEPVVVGS